MFATDRDRQIVREVSSFGQLSSGHIFELLFYGAKSQTRLHDALNRLVKSRHLAKIQRRAVGGTGAGSGPIVYRLGTEGRKYFARNSKYPYRRTLHDHTIGIADTYIGLLRLEREGKIEIIARATEPDTWQVIAGVDIRPDLFVKLGMVGKGVSVSLWIEVDTGQERPKQIKEKLASYWHVRQHATLEELKTVPRVLFLVPDDERLKEITLLIDSGPEEAKEMFRVQRQDSFPQILLS